MVNIDKTWESSSCIYTNNHKRGNLISTNKKNQFSLYYFSQTMHMRPSTKNKFLTVLKSFISSMAVSV